MQSLPCQDPLQRGSSPWGTSSDETLGNFCCCSQVTQLLSMELLGRKHRQRERCYQKSKEKKYSQYKSPHVNTGGGNKILGEQQTSQH